MSSKLKACPFCGCKPSTTTYYIECDCAMEPRIDWFHVSRESTIANWNRRTPSPTMLTLMKTCRNCWFDDEKQPERAIKEALAAVEREIGEQS